MNPLCLREESAFRCGQRGAMLEYGQPASARLASLLGTALRTPIHIKADGYVLFCREPNLCQDGLVGTACVVGYLAVFVYVYQISVFELNTGKEFCDLESF